MSLYSVALFVHIVGAMGLFVGLGLEWMGLGRMRSATTAEQALQWAGALASIRWLYPASAMAILVPGFYMTIAVWGGVAWIGIGLASMVLLAVLGAALTGRRMARIGQAATSESGAISDELGRRLRHPLLWASLQVRTGIALGIVFLMAIKPDLTGALLTIGAASVIGIVSAVLTQGGSGSKTQAALSEE